LSRRALLLADAAPGVGLGHLARSSALAQAFGAEGIEAVCTALGAVAPLERGGVSWGSASDLAAITAEPGPGELVVLDSYETGAEEARRWAGEATLAAFWDHGEPPPADLVITLAPELPIGVRGFSGLEYACLGRDYWQPPEPRIADAVGRILIAAGGADPTGAATGLCEAARLAVPGAEVTLVLGPQAPNGAPPGVTVLRAPPSLREPLLQADLIVTAAGQTMLEALASGTPCIALPLVPNQRSQTVSLAETGGVRIVEPDDPEALGEVIAELADDPGARRALSARGMESVDGRGAPRLAKELARLALS
jgi:spore coat polysaccharide biosynthesis predicted glycosyltransferase SpsG